MKLDKSDKLAKIRPFYDLIVCCCIEFQPNFEHLSVDESMLSYYGRNNSKQRIQNKPVISGFKMWVLAEPLGYVVNFHTYQGAKNGHPTRATDITWALGESVVLSLLDIMPQNTCYIFFMDVFSKFWLQIILYLQERCEKIGLHHKKRNR